MAELRRPPQQASVNIEVTLQSLQLNVVHRRRIFDLTHQSLFSDDLRAEMLKVSRARSAGQDVQHLEMSGNVTQIGNLAKERSCQRRNIAGVERKYRSGHGLSSFRADDPMGLSVFAGFRLGTG